MHLDEGNRKATFLIATFGPHLLFTYIEVGNQGFTVISSSKKGSRGWK